MNPTERKALENKMQIEASKMFNAYLDRTAPKMTRKFAISTIAIIVFSVVTAATIALVSPIAISLLAVPAMVVIVNAGKIA